MNGLYGMIETDAEDHLESKRHKIPCAGSSQDFVLSSLIKRLIK